MAKINVYNGTDSPVTTANGATIGGRERGVVDEAEAETLGLVNLDAIKKTDDGEKTTATRKSTSSTRSKSASKGADDSQED